MLLSRFQSSPLLSVPRLQLNDLPLNPHPGCSSLTGRGGSGGEEVKLTLPTRRGIFFNVFGRRKPRPKPSAEGGGQHGSRRQKLVVIGSGWASYSLLNSGLDTGLWDVSVVTNRTYFLFTPLLPSTAVGTLEFRSVAEPMRSQMKFETDHKLRIATVESIDPKQKLVHCVGDVGGEELKFQLPYDKLVVGAGSVSNTFGVKGVQEHAFFLKDLSDARKIRMRILKNLEAANIPGESVKTRRKLLQFAVVGGGPTGVELCAELHDFLKEDISRLYPHLAKDIRICLIEKARLLGAFNQAVSTWTERKIASRPAMRVIKKTVVEVGKDYVVFDDGSELPCGMVVWSGGVRPSQVVQDLPDSLWSKHQRTGALTTDPYFVVQYNQEQQRGEQDEILDPNAVYAIGDCASIEGYPLPPTAQVAETSGRWLAKALNNVAHQELQSRPLVGGTSPGNPGGESGRAAVVPSLHPSAITGLTPYRFRSAGLLAYVGGYGGVTQLPDYQNRKGIIRRGRAIKGFLSWIIWRSAYLTKLGSWRLRFLVPIGWAKTLLAGRDITQF